MSRIPPVRSWRVKFFRGGKKICDVVVDTINKDFARYVANRENGYPSLNCERITVSLVKGKRNG